MIWNPLISATSSVPELLTQLRDIHEPAAPSFWPLPIGWWIAAALALVMLTICILLVVQEQRRKRPYARIRSAAEELNQNRASGEIDALEYATSINLLFKELVIRIEGQDEAASMHGSSWLDFLAERFNDREFVEGAGRCLGSERYLPMSFSDEGLQELVHKTLRRAAPLRTGRDA